jgi:hypothetical protein
VLLGVGVLALSRPQLRHIDAEEPDREEAERDEALALSVGDA